MNPFSQNVDLSKNLFAQALSAYEELVALGLDHTQDFVSRTTLQLKGALSDPIVVEDAAQLPDAVQQNLHVAINLFRDTALATADYQLDSLRLLHNQVSEAQKTIAATIQQQFAIVEQPAPGAKRGSKTAALAQKVSA
ncbi:MAG TPA: hypothetical protein VF096_05470 [Azonexus sp.]